MWIRHSSQFQSNRNDMKIYFYIYRAWQQKQWQFFLPFDTRRPWNDTHSPWIRKRKERKEKKNRKKIFKNAILLAQMRKYGEISQPHLCCTCALCLNEARQRFKWHAKRKSNQINVNASRFSFSLFKDVENETFPFRRTKRRMKNKKKE